MIDFSHCKINPYKTFGGANKQSIKKNNRLSD